VCVCVCGVCVCVCVCVCGAYLQFVVHLKTKWPQVMCTSNRLYWWHEPACLFKRISWWTSPRTEPFFCVHSPFSLWSSGLSAVIHPYIQSSEGCILVTLHNVVSDWILVTDCSFLRLPSNIPKYEIHFHLHPVISKILTFLRILFNK
jgi:hypothetical protein